jgi:hypothetical protein
MSTTCHIARRQWLDRLAALETSGAADPLGGGALGIEHLDSCSACRGWRHGTALQTRAFRELPTLEAPEELDLRLFGSDLLASTSPDPSLEAESLAIQAVRTLDRLEAPPVLERLVAEEMERPAVARTERFVGGLERQSAPRVLEVRVIANLRQRIRPRRWMGPLVATAAAITLFWMGLNRLGWVAPGPEAKSYSFEVIRPASLEGMDPFARALAETLGGHHGREGSAR